MGVGYYVSSATNVKISRKS